MRLSDIQGGRIAVVQSKTGKPLSIPIHVGLRPTIAECRERGNLYLIARRNGEPLTTELWQAMWTREMGKEPQGRLRREGLSIHGLRALAAIRLKAVCSLPQIQAITGMSAPMVEHYTRHMDQAANAKEAIRKWEQAENRIVKRRAAGCKTSAAIKQKD